MDAFKAYRRSLTIKSAVIGAALMGLCAFIWPGNRPLLFGLGLGFAFSLVKLRLSCNNIVVFARKPAPQASAYMVQRRILTYVLTAGVLIVAFWRSDLFNGWAAAGGLFLTSAVVIADNLLIRRHTSPEPPAPFEGS